jgi:hypothetical protein
MGGKINLTLHVSLVTYSGDHAGAKDFILCYHRAMISLDQMACFLTHTLMTQPPTTKAVVVE